MQVAHQVDHITHAVLGGMGNMSFGISDDPAFFQILSSSLYKDPIKAMIRETICNGWDAHIDSGHTDTSMQITLDNEKLVIRDFGKGIPHALIQPIYGVYGASTKKNDGRQTGGFGLGCKSPFAYTDHFQVVSYHEGKKTIYNMSKSSAEKMGKPSIVPIATFPTTESGIEVTIELADESHAHRFTQLIKQVVFNGDIKATLNGQELPILNLGTAPQKFVLLDPNAKECPVISDTHNSRIYVRYGNVIYPVEQMSSIEALYKRVDNLLKETYECKLVLLAPPDSISITPSRESLTESPITTDTLTALMTAFVTSMMHNRTVATRHKEIVDECLTNAATNPTLTLREKLSAYSWVIPGVNNLNAVPVLRDTEHFAMLEVVMAYTRKKSITAALWVDAISKFLPRVRNVHELDLGKMQTWIRMAKAGQKHMSEPSARWQYNYRRSSKDEMMEAKLATQWWRKRIGVPLFMKVNEIVGNAAHTLAFVGAGVATSQRVSRTFNRIQTVRINSITESLATLLPPVLVVTHNNSTAIERMQGLHRDEIPELTEASNIFLLELARKDIDLDDVLAKLSQITNLTVVNMTGRTKTEEAEYLRKSEADRLRRERRAAIRAAAKAGIIGQAPIKKSGTGLMKMKHLVESGIYDSHGFSETTEPERLKTPECVLEISTAGEYRRTTHEFDGQLLAAVGILWGDVIGVTNNQSVCGRYIEKGSMTANQFIFHKVVNEISTSPTILKYLAYDTKRVAELVGNTSGRKCNGKSADLYRLLALNDELSHLIPGYSPLSAEDRYRLIVLEYFMDKFRYRSDKVATDLREQLKKIELDPVVVSFMEKLMGNYFVQLIDYDDIEDRFPNIRSKPALLSKTIDILSTLIN